MAFGTFEFPNASTYDSDLREVLRRLRELIDRYNLVVSSVEDLNVRVTTVEGVAEELQKEWANLEKVVNQYIQAALATFETTYDRKLQNLRDDVNNQLNDFDRRLNGIELYFTVFDEKLALLKEYSDTQDKKVIDFIIAQMTEDLNLVWAEMERLEELINRHNWTVYDPASGFVESTEQAIARTYHDNKVHGISVAEYKTLHLTVNEYESFMLTTTQYDNDAERRIQMPWAGLAKLLAVSPIDGKRKTIDNALSDIITFFAGHYPVSHVISVSEYAGLNLSVTDYAEQEWSCFDYAFKREQV